MNPHPLPRRTPGPGRDAVEHHCDSGGAVGGEPQDHTLSHAQAQVAQAHVAHAAGHVAQYRAPRGVGRPKLHLEEERSVVEWRSRQLSVVLDTKATYCSRFGKKGISHICVTPWYLIWRDGAEAWRTASKWHRWRSAPDFMSIRTTGRCRRRR